MKIMVSAAKNTIRRFLTSPTSPSSPIFVPARNKNRGSLINCDAESMGFFLAIASSPPPKTEKLYKLNQTVQVDLSKNKSRLHSVQSFLDRRHQRQFLRRRTKIFLRTWNCFAER